MISEEEIEFYKSVIDELNIVFDVGCQHDNIFDELKAGIEIHLFDPMSSDKLLSKINGKQNIRYNKYGLSSKREKVKFHPSYGSILLRQEERKFNDHTEIEIFVDTINNYCTENNIEKIDLLKIDTEGYDFEVIKGASQLLHNIKYIQFEHWNNGLTNDIIEFLRPHKIIPLDGKPKNFIAVL